ncbi:MAG: hypothetical protein WCI04_01855 [archaeon]
MVKGHNLFKTLGNRYSSQIPPQVKKIIDGNASDGEGNNLSTYQKKILQRALEEKQAERLRRKPNF